MADPVLAANYVLHHEDATMSGKVVPDPTRDDPNAVARFGVNSARHADLVPEGFFDVSKMPTAQALVEADNCFKYEYFMHLSGYDIVDQEVANKFCDLAFNEGAGQATKLVQRAVNDVLAAAEPLVVDGVPGSRTIACINACEEDQLMAAIRAQATTFYTDLAASSPQFAKDLPDWLARVND